MEQDVSMKKPHSLLVLIVVALSMWAAPAVAQDSGQQGQGEPTTTTLDACGYFVGIQTPSNSEDMAAEGGTITTEWGTWVGVSNNYGYGPVTSLGTVSGSYSDTVTRYDDGSIVGTESFNSEAGKIDQTFGYSPSTGWTVTVTATGGLAFLTSDTAGHCYTGPFPRP